MTGRLLLRGMQVFRLGLAGSGAAIVLAAPAAAQRLGQGADDPVSLWRVVLALLFCLMIAVLAALVLRARMTGRPLPAIFTIGSGQGARLRKLESVRMSHQVELSIVTCDGRDILVAVGPQGAQVLRDLSPTAPSEQARP